MNELTWCRHCDLLLALYTDCVEAGHPLSALAALQTYDEHRDQAHGPGGYPA